MNESPSICMIHEAIGDQGAIARIAMNGVNVALNAGWRVSVVAKLLDDSLRDRVEWLKLSVPPRGFAFKWLTAGMLMRRAIGGRQFDVIHAHQPQALPFADVFQCHFLTAAARERSCPAGARGAREWLSDLQERIVLSAENRCYQRRNVRCRLLFNSGLTRNDFERLYGPAEQSETLVLPCPPRREITPAERTVARKALLGGETSRTVVGFLGGAQPRKGIARLLRAIREDDRLFLLLGGPGAERVRLEGLAGRSRSVGYVKNITEFFAACDVLAAPSHYEPLGLVAFEAAAHGIPVVATDQVGALPYLLRYGAGARWDGTSAIGPVIRSIDNERAAFRAGCERMVAALSQEDYARRLLGHWETAAADKRRARDCAPAIVA